MEPRDSFKETIPAAAPSPPPPPPPTSAARPFGNPGVTKIEREHFLIHAPFQWVAFPGDNPLEFEFRNQTLREQLIVTVLLTREPLGQSQVEELAMDLANKRLNALRALSKGKAVHSPPQLQRGSGQAEVRCFGGDDPQKVRFAFVVRTTPAKVVTVALTRYFLDEVGSPFQAYAGSIFDFLQVKNAGGATST
jgi:hypothetical protein